MRLRSLRLRNHRNYAQLDLVPGPGVNIFIGANGQGKTNLLEAVAMLALSTSPRSRRELELIGPVAPMSRIAAEVESANLKAELAITLNLEGDRARVESRRGEQRHEQDDQCEGGCDGSRHVEVRPRPRGDDDDQLGGGAALGSAHRALDGLGESAIGTYHRQVSVHSPRMKTILLMRHARAEAGVPGQKDFDRTLAARGNEDAARMGRALGKLGAVPDAIVASPAARAKETAQAAARAMKFSGTIHFARALYDASGEAWLAALQAVPAAAGSALVVAHSPGIAEAASLLSGASPGAFDIPTGGLLAFDAAVDRWRDLGSGPATSQGFASPISSGDPVPCGSLGKADIRFAYRSRKTLATRSWTTSRAGIPRAIAT